MSNFRLDRLGYSLEQKEKEKRHSQCGQDDRSGPPRKGIKYAEHSDPWYTDKDETFVASPRNDTKLSVDEIIEST